MDSLYSRKHDDSSTVALWFCNFFFALSSCSRFRLAMALITLVGFPCSGKSTRAQQVKEYLESRLREESYDGPKLSVVIVNDDNCHVPRSTYDSGLLYVSCSSQVG